MACKTSYELHHHFPRLAEESGFAFNTHRPRVHIDWNKIKLIDLDSLIRERKFVLIEQHINDILDCVLESEFDVRILDDGVLKMFRLAQLAVEYQQFCRHYLDRSVYVLREEITSLAQELDATKKQLHDREEELRKIRKRTRHTYKTPLPYGNENIAAMILKTLSNKGDHIFPSSSNADILQHNKCSYCDKVFLNQLYLQSHISRRHPEVLETPQKEKLVTEQNNENARMNAEIMELRTKLKEMEQAISKASQSNINLVKDVSNNPLVTVSTPNVIANVSNNVKDAEVSTNTEDYLLKKFEQWKSEENAKYNKEITELRTQILETISSIKEKQDVSKADSQHNIIEQLQNTIKQQGIEILKLKEDLVTSQKEKNLDESEKSKETEAQIMFWSNRAEAQSKQYEALLQKLNEVAKDAKESRALAEMEREKASQLQILLQQSMHKRSSESIAISTDDLPVPNHARNPHKNDSKINQIKTPEHKKSNNIKQMTDRNTLESLHKKAQELLNLGSISSTSSDSSSSQLEEIRPAPKKIDNTLKITSNINPINKQEPPQPKERIHEHKETKVLNGKVAKNRTKKPKPGKNKSVRDISNDSFPAKSGSPMRIIRAKLTEEVNNRLSSIGVDPLKSRIERSVYQKQKMELQQLHESKIKKNPSYEKVRHGIIAFLDSNTSISNKEINGIHEYVSPNKISKSFRSLTSVFSNVKSKALSLVKINEKSEGTETEKNRTLNSDLAKKAMTLNTPSSSAPESPVQVRNFKDKSNHEYKQNRQRLKQTQNVKTQILNKKNNSKRGKPKELSDKVVNIDTEDESSESYKKYQNMTVVSESSKSIENLIKSPARRPASADTHAVSKDRQTVDNGGFFTRTQSVANLAETKAEINNTINKSENYKVDNSSDNESISDTPHQKAVSDENIQMVKQTKGVLKNASSVSSLNKKKVLFDMDAIQMKSVSASPSQSITEKSDGNDRYELGLVNLDGEDWEISSIENEPLKNDTKIQINTRTSPKIAELKQSIEAQLARRTETPSAVVGGVDLLGGRGGSNTSLGSSILDDSDGPTINHRAFVKPKKITEKDDSELDISEFSIDGLANKNESF